MSRGGARGCHILAGGLAALLVSACAPHPASSPPRVDRVGGAVVGSVEQAEDARRQRRWADALAGFEAASLADQGSYELAWKSARGALELLEESWDSLHRDERISLAQRAINHAERATTLDGARPEGHYQRAVGYGLQGKAKGLGGKRSVQPIIDSCERVIAIDPAFAGAGAHRILGALYLKAPAWPTSVGDLEKSRDELLRAVALAPEVADNHLFLAHTLVELGEVDAARAALERYRELARSVAEPPRFWNAEEREIVALLPERGGG